MAYFGDIPNFSCVLVYVNRLVYNRFAARFFDPISPRAAVHLPPPAWLVSSSFETTMAWQADSHAGRPVVDLDSPDDPATVSTHRILTQRMRRQVGQPLGLPGAPVSARRGGRPLAAPCRPLVKVTETAVIGMRTSNKSSTTRVPARAGR
jgi:hypothetical protein